MVVMSPSGKTDVTFEAEFLPTKYEIATELIPGMGSMNLRRELNTASFGIILDSPVAKKFPLDIDYGVKFRYSGNKFDVAEKVNYPSTED